MGGAFMRDGGEKHLEKSVAQLLERLSAASQARPRGLGKIETRSGEYADIAGNIAIRFL